MTFFETLLRFDQEALLNWIFLILTGFVAWYGIRHRNANGRTDFVHLLFGVVGAIFFLLVLFQDVISFLTYP
jgi:hypothetical protein